MKSWQTLAIVAGAGALGWAAFKPKKAEAKSTTTNRVIVIEDAWDVAALPVSVPRAVFASVPEEYLESSRQALQLQANNFPGVRFIVAGNQLVAARDESFAALLVQGVWSLVIAGTNLSMFDGNVTFTHVLQGTPNSAELSISAMHAAQSTLVAPVDAAIPGAPELTRLLARLRMAEPE